MTFFIEYAPWIWASIFLITLLISLKVKDIDALWFTIGSLITLIVAIIFRRLEFLYQLLIFVTLTIVPLLTVSKLLKRRHKIDKLQESSNALIGKKILVVEDCNEFNKGRGTLDNTIWTIICQPGHTLKKGEEAVIVAIENHDLIVKQAD